MFTVTTRKPEKFDGDVLVYCLLQGKKSIPECDQNIKKIVKAVCKSGNFTGKQGQTRLLYPKLFDQVMGGGFACRSILLVGLGKKEQEKTNTKTKKENEILEQIRFAGGVIASEGRKLNAGSMCVALPEMVGLSSSETAEAMSEGLLLGNYSFDKYKTVNGDEQASLPVQSFLLSGHGAAGPVRQGLKKGRVVAEAACRARDMANEPGNMWTAEAFGRYAKSIAKEHGLKHKIFGKEEIKKLGMGGLLAVNQGSATPPKLVILEYRADKSDIEGEKERTKKPVLLLVGKGLTFDSGGISIKPAAGMEDMKYDMCGGAVVLAAMQAIGEEKPASVDVVAVVPATDNMLSGQALKPGDVITHFGGKTSEIINTDAEGRLILADALAYGIKTYKPDAVVDFATLTGAVITGLGHHYTGLLANNDELVDWIISAGERAGEPFWRLPLGKEYSKQIESKVADIKNTGGRAAGTITAAAYLQEFVGDIPWAHCDIAGTSWGFTQKPYIPKGPSGVGVRTLINLVRNWKLPVK